MLTGSVKTLLFKLPQLLKYFSNFLFLQQVRHQKTLKYSEFTPFGIGFFCVSLQQYNDRRVPHRYHRHESDGPASSNTLFAKRVWLPKEQGTCFETLLCGAARHEPFSTTADTRTLTRNRFGTIL